MGVLVVAPLLLAARFARIPSDAPLHRWLEAALIAGTIAVMLIATNSHLSLLFRVFPLIIWAAIRFQLPGATPCVLFVSVLAVPAAVRSTGPFTGHGSTMVVLQALNGSAALTALLLAAVITERNITHRMIEEACADLAEVVARLAPGEVSERWPRADDNDP
jgi:integral membrane sensor domain MASE1